MRFFEDFSVGERRRIGAHTFTAEEIKRFASAFDPQPFHVDEEAAEESHFGALCASGWHTLAVWMRLNVRGLQEQTRQQAAAGETLARFGPSPGFEELKWLKPVYAGDTISYESEVVGTRASRSRPGWGLVTMRTVGQNQSGEEAIVFTAHVFVERRDKAPQEED
jgi:acyl dehydratase